MAKRDKKPSAKKSGVPRWVWGLVAVVIVPLVGARFVLRSWKSPSGSMSPTILVGDHLFAVRGGSAPPPRGEVIVFASPENRRQDFLKRVVALPGETIEALDGRPVINGWLAPHCHVGTYPQDGRKLELYVEYLGDRAFGTIFEQKLDERACKVDGDCGVAEACRASTCGVLEGPFRVKSGEVFVMGDNRNNSHDSRSWFGGLGGGVPVDLVHGSAAVVWMSPVPGRTFASLKGPPVLPPEALSLQPALDACLRDRPPPDRTTPPRG